MDDRRNERDGGARGIGPVALGAGIGLIFGAAFGVPAVGMVLGAAAALARSSLNQRG